MGIFYAGLDVSDKTTCVCVLGADGAVACEQSVETNPSAIARALSPYKRVLEKVGLESGSKAAWLHKELSKRRYPIVCMDARVAHGALSTQRNKTDKNDARGLAQVLRNGWYANAYVKSDEASRLRLLLIHRRVLKRKAVSLELALRGSVKPLGAVVEKKAGQLRLKQRPRRADPLVTSLAEAMVRARGALLREVEPLDEMVEKLAKKDPVCRRLMTIPGVGPVTALTYRAAVDDPHRFKSSRNVAAHFGLTPRRFQSGAMDITGHISKMGDKSVRSALYEAAIVMLTVSKSPCRLRQWGLRLRERKGVKPAAIAVARKLAVIMHRMWLTGCDFDSSPAAARGVDAGAVDQRLQT
jgi:transposase